MILKKINAFLALLIVLSFLVHVGECIVMYVTMDFYPLLTQILAAIPMTFVMLHGICSVVTLAIGFDGSSMMKYKKLNFRLLLQRITAVLMIFLLPLHIRTFKWIYTGEVTSSTIRILLDVATLIFFVAVFLHASVSLSNAFVTLGWIQTAEGRKKVDRVSFVVCAIVFVGAILALMHAPVHMTQGSRVT